VCSRSTAITTRCVCLPNAHEFHPPWLFSVASVRLSGDAAAALQSHLCAQRKPLRWFRAVLLCCNTLYWVAACCAALQHVVLCCNWFQCVATQYPRCNAWYCVAAYSVLQRAVLCRNVLPCCISRATRCVARTPTSSTRTTPMAMRLIRYSCAPPASRRHAHCKANHVAASTA